LNTYFALFLIATIVSLTITPLVRRICERFRLLDVPIDERRVHRKAVPRLGGIAVYLSCLAALAILPFLDNTITQDLRAHTPEILTIVIPCTLVLLLGIYDDVRGANATVKFLVLGLVATLFFAMGGRIEGLTIPFAGSVHLPLVVSFVFTVFWLVGITNAFNLIDGLDGLAAGAALFSSLVILAVSFAQGQPLTIVAALVLCGALAGFLRYNFNPASIFLGDSGALFIGFMLAALSVVGMQKATTAVAVVIPILAFGLPVIDTAITISRRLISRKPVFKGDDEHIHHMLLARGWSQRQVAMALYGVCAAFGLVAVAFGSTGSNWMGFVLFVITVALSIALGQLRYHEVDELKAGMKRTVGDRRVKVANNIRVRRAARALSKASDLHEMFEAVRQMLEFGEFAYAHAILGRSGDAEVNERAFNARKHLHANQALELRAGRISWSWHQPGIAAEDVLDSTAFWCLRLPLGDERIDLGSMEFYRAFGSDPLLVDTNYLVGLFRDELSVACARILSSHEVPIGLTDLPITVNAEKITG
jgi:UDP-GlcNAc:undecaprenyl-phosphate/decaprenyl-phosphate GlcNAc-1-phosphate transferase